MSSELEFGGVWFRLWCIHWPLWQGATCGDGETGAAVASRRSTVEESTDFACVLLIYMLSAFLILWLLELVASILFLELGRIWLDLFTCMLPFINIQLMFIFFTDLIIGFHVYARNTITPIPSCIFLITPLVIVSLLAVKTGLVIFLMFRHLRFDGSIFVVEILRLMILFKIFIFKISI